MTLWSLTPQWGTTRLLRDSTALSWASGVIASVPPAVTALLTVVGALVGSLATVVVALTKNRNESAQVAINGLDRLVAAQQLTIAAQQATIARLELRVGNLEERLHEAGLPIHGDSE